MKKNNNDKTVELLTEHDAKVVIKKDETLKDDKIFKRQAILTAMELVGSLAIGIGGVCEGLSMMYDIKKTGKKHKDN